MEQYIQNFLQQYDYPEEARREIINTYHLVKDYEVFNQVLTDFYTQEPGDFLGVLGELSKQVSIHPDTVYLVYYICLSRELKEEYKKSGIDEAIFFDSMKDLKYKLLEGYELKKVWGLWVPGWTCDFFRKKLFALGRMQYMILTYEGEDICIGDCVIKKGMKYADVHIPTSKEPFNKEARIASYDKAYHFFKDQLEKDMPIFMCYSWLLYPPNKEILGEKSNIVSFINDFKIYESEEFNDSESRRDMWRIFGVCANTASVEELPRKTSLQRAYADWFLKGNKAGLGKGAFIYDPVNKKTLT